MKADIGGTPVSSQRRKSCSAPLMNNMDEDEDDDDDISTDGETYFSSLSGYKRSSSQDAVINTFSLWVTTKKVYSTVTMFNVMYPVSAFKKKNLTTSF